MVSIHDLGGGKWTTGTSFLISNPHISNGDLVVIYFVTSDSNFPLISSMSDALGVVAWQPSARYTSPAEYSGTTKMQVWYGVGTVGASGLSDAVTVNLTGTPRWGTQAMIVVISGADATTPFDLNASVPAIAQDTGSNVTPTVNISTSNAPDVIIGFVLVFSATAPSVGTIGGVVAISLNTLADTTGIDGGNQTAADEYFIVSTTLSAAAVNFVQSSNSGYVMLADAVRAAAGPAGLPTVLIEQGSKVYQYKDFKVI